MVFQDYALYPHMTVRRNLEFPLRMRGTAARRARPARRDAWRDRSGSTPCSTGCRRQLSGGQRQRVAMGRALVREPGASRCSTSRSRTSTPSCAARCAPRSPTLQRRTRTTMLYVTHDQVEAMTLGDRVAVLDHGVLQQVAPPARALRPAGQRLRRGLHRQPADEPLSEPGGRRRWTRRARDRRPDGDDRRGTRRRRGARPSPRGFVPSTSTVVERRAGTIDATVAHVELLGHETLVYADIAGVRLVVRTEGMSSLGSGERVALQLDPNQVHVFPPQSATRTHPAS